MSEAIKALEQIAVVCTDNMDRDCDHRMTLDFVRQIANDCLGAAQTAPMDFFSENVDAWGALEWFNRLAKAIRGHDAAVVSGEEMTMETCRNVAASSAMRLVREYENQVRAALLALSEGHPRPSRDELIDKARLALCADAGGGGHSACGDYCTACKRDAEVAVDTVLAALTAARDTEGK